MKALDPKLKLTGILKPNLQDLLIDALRAERLRREINPDNMIDDINDMSIDEIILTVFIFIYTCKINTDQNLKFEQHLITNTTYNRMNEKSKHTFK